MQQTRKWIKAAIVAIGMFSIEAVAADTVKPVDGTTATPVTTRLTGEFSGFAGSDANSASLVSGLRSGSTIVLVPEGGTPTTIAPPTRPMGYGNVRISIALARQQLVGLGITEPTPEQIKAALTGGTVTTPTGTATLTGVLTQRSQGMGWGQIAQSQGVTLGSVMSGMSRAEPAVVHSATTGRSGIVTATGGAAAPQVNGDQDRSRNVVRGDGSAASQGGANGNNPGAGGGQHRGIVTAAGASSAYGISSGGSRSGMSGIVHGDGAAPGAAAASGRGKGH